MVSASTRVARTRKSLFSDSAHCSLDPPVVNSYITGLLKDRRLACMQQLPKHNKVEPKKLFTSVASIWGQVTILSKGNPIKAKINNHIMILYTHLMLFVVVDVVISDVLRTLNDSACVGA